MFPASFNYTPSTNMKSHLITKVMFICQLAWPYLFTNGTWSTGAMTISNRQIKYLEEILFQ
jgi:hypothetical protein